MASRPACRRRAEARPPRRRGRRVVSLTPLIDVVFILLVFFMLASSFSDWRTIELDIPSSTRGDASLTGSMLVDVREDGMRLAGRETDLAGLAQAVRERLAVDPEQRVVIRPAIGVNVQRSVEVLDALREVGAFNLSFAPVRAAGPDG